MFLHEDFQLICTQRSDIAMAITKNDMFDFLIDIVPREEIQLKTKSQKVSLVSLTGNARCLLQEAICRAHCMW